MKKIYVTSDWHFNHDKEFVWQARGFTSVEEMNECIIENHNNLVNPEDEVYVLGDLCLGGGDSLLANKTLIERLNGNIHVIRGNHCTNSRIAMYESCNNICEVVSAMWLDYQKFHFYLSHFPTITSNFDDGKSYRQRVWNLCGHSHTTDALVEMNQGIPAYHVEMDAHNCTPVLLDDIIEVVKAFAAGVSEAPASQPSSASMSPAARDCTSCEWRGTCGSAARGRVCKLYKKEIKDGGYYR